jgi:hypothetical protein
MATYHGIVKATCLECDYTSSDDTTLELWNDYGGDCPRCNANHDMWELADGTVVVTDDEDA